MSSNSWSSEDDEVLIDFVRNHEAIYNIKSKEYRKTQLKQNWWCEIGEILNKSDSDCSKRWCYLRDYYIRRRGKPGSSGQTARKRSKLLSFLDSLPSSQRSSITNVEDENSADNNVIIENTCDISEGIQTLEDGTTIIENTQNNEETQEVENKNDNKAKSNRKQEHSQERLNLLKRIANWNSAQSGLDENDLFFGSMSKIAKKLPPYEQVQLRLQIGSLVGNAELRQILKTHDYL